ncbi:hypothetical protein R6Y90_15945 [Alteromonas macleodii]|uniref:hypothetical protein n=1 Tax=Alteromonas macleodii TaxID=28108 RepID=UPI002980E39E|nr:hypothetical protein [Alteromonas macleodii]MDW5286455.1 hypothetical protein [Alteromonas macleodii]
MSYSIHPFWKVEKLLSPQVSSQTSPHMNVILLSHHIPKTAGSSLRLAFEAALGRRIVYGIYENTDASAMSEGRDLWIPAKAEVLHGHFKPDEKHKYIFPLAKRAVWVRDPIERLWSLVGHLLALKERHPHYFLLKASLPKISFNSQEDIVKALILEDKVRPFTHAYANFFKSVSIKNFEFVGSKHNYSDGLTKLSEMIGTNLKKFEVNRRTPRLHKLPASLKQLEPYLQHEYAIVGDYL